MASEGAIIPQLVESVTQSPAAATCSGPMAGGDISSSAHTGLPCHTEVYVDEKTRKELFTDTFCRVCGAVLQFESHKNAHYEGKRHAQKVRLYFLNKELEEIAYKRKAEHVHFHVNQEIANDKNKFCSLCNMVFSSPVVAQSHYVGKIHAKKVKQLAGEQSDSTAEAGDSSGTMQDSTAVPPHPESSPVALPLSSQQEANSEQPSSATTDKEIDLTDPKKYCKLCCATFNKPLVAAQHYNGKKHARNEMRQKMMEEMEDTGMTVEAGVEGIYVCPICSIKLTSIEMYQSHMQGNKHLLNEHKVANVMRTTKKNYDSFENELQDYIKVQKARGLEPKTQFRQEKDHDSEEETLPAPIVTHPHPKPVAPPRKYFPQPPKAYPAAYNPLHAADPRRGSWEQGYWHEKPVVRKPIKTGPPKKPAPSSSDSSDYSSSDESSDSVKKEKRHKREHRSKDRKRHNKSKRENGSSERKRRKLEDTDSGKEDTEKEKKADMASADKSKPRKDKKKKDDQPVEKESKKHKKSKKVEDQRTEEEILWDESILGF